GLPLAAKPGKVMPDGTEFVLQRKLHRTAPPNVRCVQHLGCSSIPRLFYFQRLLFNQQGEKISQCNH
ncbi:hypothetical protein, partial [Serratia marcescens]|uniref:hypothetical protein n=1 Tax=Serratia marcescens TaxID=615 RepID=UPI001ED8F0B1